MSDVSAEPAEEARMSGRVSAYSESCSDMNSESCREMYSETCRTDRS